MSWPAKTNVLTWWTVLRISSLLAGRPVVARWMTDLEAAAEFDDDVFPFSAGVFPSGFCSWLGWRRFSVTIAESL